jgi:hypothetical protein
MKSDPSKYNSIILQIDRDSVSLGDDIPNHREEWRMASSLTLTEVFRETLKRDFLPCLYYMPVVWVGFLNRIAISVISPQLPECYITPDAESLWSEVRGHASPSLRFEYLSCANGFEVFEAILADRTIDRNGVKELVRPYPNWENISN